MMQKKQRCVVLISPPSNCVDDDRLEPPLGLLYLAAYLNSNSVNAVIYDMTGNDSESSIEKKIEAIPAAGMYGFTVYCTNYDYVKRCIRFIREKHPCSYIILGGPNPTALPEFTLNDSGCDYIITGEGEEALLSLARSLLSGAGYPVRIIQGTPVREIDTLPIPDRSLIDEQSYTRTFEGEKAACLISSRGCIYNCIHCNSIIMGCKGVARCRSPGNIIQEMLGLIERGYRKFRFNDDLFSDHPQLAQLCSEIEKLDVRYRIFARIEDLTEKNCELLKKSGCTHAAVGIESVNPLNLKILGKGRQINCIKPNLENCRKAGITTRVYFIVGLPFDTDESIRRDFTKASMLPFDEYSIYPLIPYPGTRIWEDPQKYGYTIIDDDFTGYVQIGKGKNTTFVLEHKNFTVEQVKKWFAEACELFQSQGKLLQKDSMTAC